MAERWKFRRLKDASLEVAKLAISAFKDSQESESLGLTPPKTYPDGTRPVDPEVEKGYQAFEKAFGEEDI